MPELMVLMPSTSDILVRLLLTVIAGLLVGLDRGARGHAAGLRTTTLVTLAACIAMLQANILPGAGTGRSALLDSIDATTLVGLRDRALIGLMVYSLARIICCGIRCRIGI